MMDAPLPVRERLLASATRLFEENSIRSVSADKVIADAGTTKVTFYRHFRSKDQLVVAYLDAQLERLQSALDTERETGRDACAVLLRLAAANGDAACRPGFRGCTFINAAAEYPAEGNVVRAAVERYRSWLHGVVAGLLAELGVDRPDAVADQLIMLRDGAMVHGYMGDPSAVTEQLTTAGRAIIAAHLRTPLPA
ncbi:TetR/AcrR family transcriptional regulator [Arthrobacter agilis]|jgi:AcrR family transcriptional regulator|uniref:TetR/AcrR family transcriptional regulator n=1 Tax=Arthrobacter agilis TaxID=37921 RepID=UPI0027825BDA|nr:TetR/AcrR family transcriptional regulator [Arthrobacter agilis]MDQ0736046.1 AcrR family transcriptional regulator [Arthrobacter agilis]